MVPMPSIQSTDELFQFFAMTFSHTFIYFIHFTLQLSIVILLLVHALLCSVHGLNLVRFLFGICDLKSIKNVHYRCVVCLIWLQPVELPKWLHCKFFPQLSIACFFHTFFPPKNTRGTGTENSEAWNERNKAQTAGRLTKRIEIAVIKMTKGFNGNIHTLYMYINYRCNSKLILC